MLNNKKRNLNTSYNSNNTSLTKNNKNTKFSFSKLASILWLFNLILLCIYHFSVYKKCVQKCEEEENCCKEKEKIKNIILWSFLIITAIGLFMMTISTSTSDPFIAWVLIEYTLKAVQGFFEIFLNIFTE